jgi:hypothetical protein
VTLRRRQLPKIKIKLSIDSLIVVLEFAPSQAPRCNRRINSLAHCSRGCHNAARNPNNRVAVFRPPRADAALRARLAEKFFGQFSFAALALPKT